MPRASNTQKGERLNLARDLLRRHKAMPEAVEELVRTCAISHRQAYRYLKEAQQLKEPVPVVDTKVAFTVKLSRSLINRLRRYASSTGLTLSEIVSRAVLMLLSRGARGG